MTAVDSAATTESTRNVEELENALELHPDDGSLKRELAEAIIQSYLQTAGDDDDDDDDANDKQLERLRSLLKQIPEPQAPFPRACLSFDNEEFEEAIDWLAIHASNIAKAGNGLSFERFANDFVNPFGNADNSFWAKLAEVLKSAFPDSAATFYMQALASEGDGDSEASYYKQALDKDSTYWTAAMAIGDIYFDESNWQSASVYYEQALKSQSAQELDTLHFSYAWCLGKLKRYSEEEKHFRECLRLDPLFPYARNNLGLSVLHQKRYEEALTIFDESIAQGSDGPYPFRNRAVTLKSLKRYSEAIDAWVARANWRGGNPVGKFPASIQAEINRLQKLIKLQADTEISTNKISDESTLTEDVGEDESADALPDHNNEDETAPSKELPLDNRGKVVKTASPTEVLLEESIEKLIKQGKEVFGRRLRLYESTDGLSARQYTFSDGRIDLLAEDMDSGDLVIIELKKDEGHERIVGQILLYMNWAKENLAKKNQAVRGVICVFAASSKLKLAASNNSNLEVFEYGLSFSKV